MIVIETITDELPLAGSVALTGIDNIPDDPGTPLIVAVVPLGLNISVPFPRGPAAGDHVQQVTEPSLEFKGWL